MAVFDEIKPIIAEEAGISEDRIKESSNIEADFQADSLTRVEIVMAIEDRYGIEIPEEELEGVRTVADLVTHIEAALAAKQ
jgi:acyl carrier protein